MPPATRTVWINQIHAAGGARGSITMVVVFVGCLRCCGWTRDVKRSFYVKYGTKINKNYLKMRFTVVLFDPRTLAPYLLIAFLNDPLRMHQENFASNYDIFTGKVKLPTSTLDEIHTGSL
jgi:hypothetical protein